jgi:hypothetical protein
MHVDIKKRRRTELTSGKCIEVRCDEITIQKGTTNQTETLAAVEGSAEEIQMAMRRN